MHIVVTGGTGFIGRALCESLFVEGHRVSILTRNVREASQLLGTIVAAVEWNGRESGAWEQSLEGADAVINLAGAPIADARWTDARKRLLTDSRVLTLACLWRPCPAARRNPGRSSVHPASASTEPATIVYWMRALRAVRVFLPT